LEVVWHTLEGVLRVWRTRSWALMVLMVSLRSLVGEKMRMEVSFRL
jgi:hypothetical protein